MMTLNDELIVFYDNNFHFAAGEWENLIFQHGSCSLLCNFLEILVWILILNLTMKSLRFRINSTFSHFNQTVLVWFVIVTPHKMSSFTLYLKRISTAMSYVHVIDNWRQVFLIIFRIILSANLLKECAEKSEIYLNVKENVVLNEIIISFYQTFVRYNCLKNIYEKLFWNSNVQNDHHSFDRNRISLRIELRWIFHVDVVRDFNFVLNLYIKLNENSK